MRQTQSLHGPWRDTPLARITITEDEQWVADTRDLPAGGEMRLPAHWERAGLAGFAGTVRFARHFDAPPLQAIERDIALLKDAHVNGVHINRQELYDALDRAGILVWQEFALQWGYQQTDAFIAEAIRQVKDMVLVKVLSCGTTTPMACQARTLKWAKAFGAYPRSKAPGPGA